MWPPLASCALLARLYQGWAAPSRQEQAQPAAPAPHRLPAAPRGPARRPLPPPGGLPLTQSLVASLLAPGSRGALDLSLERLVSLEGIQQWCPQLQVRGGGGRAGKVL